MHRRYDPKLIPLTFGHCPEQRNASSSGVQYAVRIVPSQVIRRINRRHGDTLNPGQKEIRATLTLNDLSLAHQVSVGDSQKLGLRKIRFSLTLASKPHGTGGWGRFRVHRSPDAVIHPTRWTQDQDEHPRSLDAERK